MQSQRTRTHLTCIPNFGIETYATTMQVVRTVVQCQLIFLAVQGKLTFADAVSPASNQRREIRLLSAGQLLDAAMTLNNVSYISILVWNHDSTDSTTIIRDSNFVTFAVAQDV